MIDITLRHCIEDAHELKPVEERRQRLGEYASQNHEVPGIDHGDQALHIVILGLAELEIVSKNVVVHVTYELGHENVDVLAQQLMRRIPNDLSDFPVAVLNDANVAPLSGDDDDCRDGVVPVLFLFDFAMELSALGHCPFDCLYGLLVALVGFVRIDNNLHEVGVKDKGVNVGGVDLVEPLEALSDLI